MKYLSKLVNTLQFIMVCIIFCSCQQKVLKTYYDTGELKVEKFLKGGNDSIIYFREYFKNGNIKQEGTIRNDTVMDGHYKLYYADKKLLWEGEIINNVIQDRHKWQWNQCKDCFQGIEIEGDPDQLIPHQVYKFRVNMPKVYPRFYDARDEDFYSLANQDTKSVYTYPYVFAFNPNKNGEYIIKIVFMKRDGNFIVGSPYIECTLSTTLSDSHLEFE
ncbi:hypothetical protein ACE1ET_17815 [Saccharicrinis sp. FJH62]|uniref:hypothetical protein n=1 Tax=Saccharicrinis sp. FJH62 TaxID=3344657 RepID=UPI0035D3F79E